jgi:hypothetical protein
MALIEYRNYGEETMKTFPKFGWIVSLALVVVKPSFSLDAHDLQKDCTSTLNGPLGYALGYITAVAEERATLKSPTKDGALASAYIFPSHANRAELRDAICKYVDLHPEIWARSYHDGVIAALDALYMNQEVKAP